MVFARLALYGFTLFALVACGKVPHTRGTSTSDVVDTQPAPAAPSEGTFDDAASVYPSVRKALGGSAVKAPRFQPIVFADDPLAADIEAFSSALAASGHWREGGKEYGVGAAHAEKPWVMEGEAPKRIDDSEIQAWVRARLRDGGDAETLYAFYFPERTRITVQGHTSCEHFGGYHSDMVVSGSAKVGYAVIARCETEGKELDRLTTIASHEYFEWATNPFPSLQPAYRGVNPVHYAWSALGAELADLCALAEGGARTFPEDMGGYAVQNYWSNRRAQMGLPPCGGSAPTLALSEALDPITVSTSSGPVETQGVRLTQGAARALQVTLPVGTQRLQVLDPFGHEEPEGLHTEFDQEQGRLQLEAEDVAGPQVITLRVTTEEGTSIFPLVVEVH